jgi:homoserine dehydrogenase
VKRKTIRIGVLGCGTVGTHFINALIKNNKVLRDKTGIEFSVVKVCDKDKKKRKIFPAIFTVEDREVLESKNVDVVVELVGGVDYAYEAVKKALTNGKSVVTANKALISENGREIFKLAEENKVHIGFEASVAGAVPIIKTIRESFIGNKLSRLLGILNGTTNYILTRMSLSAYDFSQALSQAQKFGYAEANPILDITGLDTAHKLSILSTLAFNKTVHWKDIPVEGIEKINPMDIAFTKEFGYRIKLLAIAQNKGSALDIRVHPTLLPQEHPLSPVEGVYNAIYIEGNMAGKALFYGEGAGGNAAASAVISDVVDIGKKLAYDSHPCKRVFYEDKKITLVPIKEISTKYYFRFTALDKPGVLARIADILGKNGISIASVIQKQESPERAVPILMLTHNAKEESVQKAINQINKLEIIKKPTVLLRVEE